MLRLAKLLTSFLSLQDSDNCLLLKNVEFISFGSLLMMLFYMYILASEVEI